ncbi:MAG: SMI1/KNR4 family protein [Arenimonas sp.]
MKQPPNPGASDQLIHAAEVALGIEFSAESHEIWKTYNCNDLPGGWRVFPIFDPANPRKTAGNIVYENLKGVWGMHVMESGLISIADNGTGNQLVLKVVSAKAGTEVFRWDHETEKLTSWKPGMKSILRIAKKSREKLAALQQRFSN